jgi:hypothetical protein
MVIGSSDKGMENVMSSVTCRDSIHHHQNKQYFLRECLLAFNVRLGNIAFSTCCHSFDPVKFSEGAPQVLLSQGVEGTNFISHSQSPRCHPFILMQNCFQWQFTIRLVRRTDNKFRSVLSKISMRFFRANSRKLSTNIPINHLMWRKIGCFSEQQTNAITRQRKVTGHSKDKIFVSDIEWKLAIQWKAGLTAVKSKQKVRTDWQINSEI